MGPAGRMVAAFIVLVAATAVEAQVLYTASTRSYFAPSDVVGRLYVVDPETAAAREIGPIRLAGGVYLGITGLAVHPRDGTLYGITAGLVPSVRPSLVKIDPASAEATLVGPLGHAASDINFDAEGTLFIWLTDVNRLGTVDLKTGAASPRGPALAGTDAPGGGIAIDGRGVAYIAATTAAGTLDTVQTKTGERAVGPVLSGAPYLSSIHSMTFSRDGTLYGVNSNMAAPSRAMLVTIDPRTGVVTPVGPLPEDADGLAFSERAVSTERQVNYTYLALSLAALIAVFALIFLRRR